MRSCKKTKQFTIFVENKTSELVKVSDAIGKRGVNIKAIVTEYAQGTPYVKLVTDDVQTTHRALKTAGLEYEDKDILSVEMPDKPGEFSKIAKMLTRAKISIESLYILGQSRGRTEVALIVDDLDGAKKALNF